MNRSLLCVILAAGTTLSACEEKAPPPMPARTAPAAPPQTTPAPAAATPAATSPAAPASPAPPAAPAANANTFPVGGIEMSVPAGWKPAPVTNTPFAPVGDLRFAHPAGEARAAFFAVEGGGKDANLQRWQRQMTLTGEAKITSSEIGGMAVTRIDMVGEYRGMTPTGSAAAPAPNTRFIGYIIEGGPRPVQIRLTGPKEAVDVAFESLEAMLGKMAKPK